MGAVVFTSNRPLHRAENIKAVFDAYDGEKVFSNFPVENVEKYDLMVTDELPNAAPKKCLFIGHGMGAGKLYGLDQPNPYFHSPHLITRAIASSIDMIPIVAGYCGIPKDRVVPLGMPRTDGYFSGPVAHKSRRHLYAPTFRSGRWLPDFNLLWRLLPEGEQFIVKLHMVTGNQVQSHWDSIKIASSAEPSAEYLKNADTVVTDYSSIMFDAMVLRIPVVLFAKDSQNFLKNRGMYCEYPGMYSPNFCDNEQDLMEHLAEARWDDRLEYLRQYHAGLCDGKSTERCIELIRSMV